MRRAAVGDVAVVGIGGTLGARIADRLGAKGIELRRPDPRVGGVVPDLAGAKVVIHAGGPRVRRGLGWPDYFREHVGVTAAVVRSMRSGARLVHVSSTAVYGARGEALVTASSEAPTLFPYPAYACAKWAAEATARALAAERGIELVVLRPSMVYGPGVDSALGTLRRLHRRGVALRLVPRAIRQHLVHIDVVMAVVERAVEQRPAGGGASSLGRTAQGATVLLVADPFVLTNADLAPLPSGLSLDLDLRTAGKIHERILGAVGVSAGPLGALAVLGLDNTFDVEPTWRSLDLDPAAFGRPRTFDAYWDAEGRGDGAR